MCSPFLKNVSLWEHRQRSVFKRYKIELLGLEAVINIKNVKRVSIQ